MSKKNLALEWAKRCKQSNGSSYLLSAEFKERAADIFSEIEEIDKMNKELKRKIADFENFKNNFWYEVRQELEKQGSIDCFEKQIDFDVDAKKDGFYVVNLYADKQGPPMGMPIKTK